MTHAALDGHSIPLDRGALDVLVCRWASLLKASAKSGKVSGLERVIPKSKRGRVQLAACTRWRLTTSRNPFSPNVRKPLLSINPEAKDRFPKRGVKKEPEPVAAPAAVAATGKKKGAVPEKPAGKGTDKQPERASEKAGEKSAHAEKPVHAEKAHSQKTHAEKSVKSEKHSDKHTDKHAEKHAEKPSPRKKVGPPPKSSKPHPHPLSGKRKPAAKQLSKRKPR